MKILHTSDWHIGHTLYAKKRYDEHEQFLGWLRSTICEREIDGLLVAGDVFDNGAPGGQAQRLYYDFSDVAAWGRAAKLWWWWREIMIPPRCWKHRRVYWSG